MQTTEKPRKVRKFTTKFGKAVQIVERDKAAEFNQALCGGEDLLSAAVRIYYPKDYRRMVREYGLTEAEALEVLA